MDVLDHIIKRNTNPFLIHDDRNRRLPKQVADTVLLSYNVFESFLLNQHLKS